MKVNEFENRLTELEHPKAPDKVSLDVLSFAEKRSELVLGMNKKQNIAKIPFIKKLLLTIAGAIPFIEIFWVFNEVFVKKNKIKLHW